MFFIALSNPNVDLKIKNSLNSLLTSNKKISHTKQNENAMIYL